MSGKGGNNRKNRRFSGRRDDSHKHAKKHQENPHSVNQNNQDKPLWTAPVLPSNPVNSPDCPWCGKQIKDIATAICDKDTGRPVHFDCVLARIAEMEKLETNDSVCYIGGGRFGIVHYNNPPDTRDFTIKKIFEWESKDSNNEWRKPVSGYFSLT